MKDLRKYWDERAGFGPERSVIDHNDKKGYKNRYIKQVGYQAVLKALNGIPSSAMILDFGCGSGNLSKALAEKGYSLAGVDISIGMLGQAKGHNFDKESLFVQYDGRHIPFATDCFDACVIFGVLVYMTETDHLCRALKEIFRTLKPGGKLILVEDTCRKSKLVPDKKKLLRTTEELLQLLAISGFVNRGSRIIRRGHFPLIYLIRYGIIPASFFSMIATIEKFFGKIFRRPCFDYADTIFISEKPVD